MEVLLSLDETIITIDTDTKFQSMLEEFFYRHEKMVFITLHPPSFLITQPDALFIQFRYNVMAKFETWAAFLHTIN